MCSWIGHTVDNVQDIRNELQRTIETFRAAHQGLMYGNAELGLPGSVRHHLVRYTGHCVLH